MNTRSLKEQAHMQQSRLAVIAALVLAVCCCGNSLLAQEEGSDEAKAEESKPTETKHTKESLKLLTSEELANLLQDCANNKLSNPNCADIQAENFRRIRDKDRPVDLETIKPEQPFGGVYQPNEKNDRKADVPPLVEHPVSPPSSIASETDSVNTIDPRDVRDTNRSKPPSSIPTFSGSEDRSDNKSDSN